MRSLSVTCVPPTCRFLFTSNPRGSLKLWALDKPLQSLTSDTGIGRCFDVFLLAEFTSSLKVRLMCLDASVEEEVLCFLCFSYSFT